MRFLNFYAKEKGNEDKERKESTKNTLKNHGLTVVRALALSQEQNSQSGLDALWTKRLRIFCFYSRRDVFPQTTGPDSSSSHELTKDC
jgi:hypothetical protein